MIDALGMIEVIGLIPAVAAADSAVKAADVHILKLYKVDGGIVTLAVTGDVGAVRAAVDAGTETARALGPVRATHVIARLQAQVEEVLPAKTNVQLKVAAFMEAVPMVHPPQIVDAEGRPAAETPLALAASVEPPEEAKPANKRTRRKKTEAPQE